jgi:hypothetical protein
MGGNMKEFFMALAVHAVIAYVLVWIILKIVG